MKHEKIIGKIKEILRGEFAKFGISQSDLEDNGRLIYWNGNDSTKFDWNCNGRLCEIGVCFKGNCYFAGKALVYKSGKIDVYVYPDTTGEGYSLTSVCVGDNAHREFKRFLVKNADDKLIWDKPLSYIYEKADLTFEDLF